MKLKVNINLNLKFTELVEEDAGCKHSKFHRDGTTLTLSH